MPVVCCRPRAEVTGCYRVKLLFDQNLSRYLPSRLEDLYPESAHVGDHELSRASDADVWAFAKSQGFVIVSKDDDFRQRSFLEGAPPKVICVQLGNCSTNALDDILRKRFSDISDFGEDADESFMLLS